jgi:hypothetical protein
MGTPQERTPMSIERILLIVVSVLLVIAIIFIAVSQLTGKPKEEAEETAVEPTTAAAATLPPAQPTEAPMAAPTEKPAAAPEASPTSGVQRLAIDPTPTPFMVNSDDRRAILDLGHPDYTDQFNNPKTWYNYGADKSSGKAEYKIEGGELIGTDFDAEDKGLYWTTTAARAAGRLYAEVSATNGDCQFGDAVGFVVRVQADKTPSGYGMEISCDGSYRFIRFREAGRPTATLIDWTPSGAINQGLGATNRLGVWGYDGNFYLYINNIEIAHFYDNGMPEGYSFGYFAAYVRSQTTFPLTATFDDFAVWDLPWLQ